ncbi:CU044_2847 family protein [Micromonospora sp. DT47]|uniref:CU044_2847 family protein n=1 Tax=Micromonospora sp. DT47 TaxID=3393431 RepID=UPI003CEDA315
MDGSEGNHATSGEPDNDVGAPVHVEVVPDPRFLGHLGPADLVERFSDRAAELGAAIGAVGEQLRRALELRMAQAPQGAWELSQISVELALNLEAESGVIIAKAKSAAAFQASLTWTRRSPARAPASGEEAGGPSGAADAEQKT